MSENRWDNAGQQIRDAVEDAIYYGDFTNLGRSIGNVINDAVDTMKGSSRESSQSRSIRQDASEQTQSAAGDTSDSLYERQPGGQVSSIMMCVLGSIFTVIFGICFIVFLVVVLAGGFPALGGMILFAVLTVIALVSAIRGSIHWGRIRRYRRYLKVVRQSVNIPIRELASRTGKSLEFTTSDLLRMIDLHWFHQAHVDEETHYLILSDAAYQDYLSAKRDCADRARRNAETDQKNEGLSPECRSLIERGEEYVRHIHESNERIPGREFSEKLDQLERVVARIFEVVRLHPEVSSELDKLMSYYLPTTKKLLDAYQELDSQPAAGKNIASSKKEIEEAVDALNMAFERLLDSLFEDRAWDISSDISVLHTVLAQDGLKEGAFEKKPNAPSETIIN